MISIYYVYVIPLFVIYQLIDLYDVNLFVYLVEFAIGYIFGLLLFAIPLNNDNSSGSGRGTGNLHPITF